MSGNRADLNKADKLIAQGKLQSAIDVYQKYLRDNADDSTIQNAVGDLYVRIGEPKAAVPHFQKSAESLEKSGFRAKAIAVLRKAYRQAPSNSQIVETLAVLLREEGLIADARTMLMDLARNRQQLGHLQEARNLYKKVLEIDPQNLQTLLKISELAAKEGNIEEECEAYCSVATHLANSARYEEAIEIIESAYRSTPSHMELARIYSDLLHRTGETEKAKQILTVAHKENPEDAGLMVALAELSLEKGELDEALDLFNQARQRDPEAPRVLLLGGSIAVARRDYDTAVGYYQPLIEAVQSTSEGGPVIAALEELVRRNPDHIRTFNKLKSIYTYIKDKVSLARVLIRLSEAHERSGDYKLAIEDAEQLLSLEPEKLSHKNRLEKLYSRSQGAAIFDDASSADTSEDIPETLDLTLDSEKEQEPDPRISRILLETEVFLRYGLTQKARERLNEALTIDENEPLTHERMADIFFEDQENEAAVAALERAAELWEARGRTDKAIAARERAKECKEGSPGVSELILNEEDTAADLSAESGTEIIESPAPADTSRTPMAPWVPSTDPLQGKLAEAEYYLEQNFISAAHHLLSQLREQHSGHEEVQRLWTRLEDQMKSEMDVTEVEKDLDDFFTTLEDTSDSPKDRAIATITAELEVVELPQEAEIEAEAEAEAEEEPARIELESPALEPTEEDWREMEAEAAGAESSAVEREEAAVVEEPTLPAEASDEPELNAEEPATAEEEEAPVLAAGTAAEETGVQADEAPVKSEPEPEPPAEKEEFSLDDDSPLKEIADILEEDLYAVHTAAVKRLDELQESHQEIASERILGHLSNEFDPGVLRESAAKHYEMGVAYLEAGLYEDAINEFQISAEDPLYYQQACLKLGICYLSKGIVDAATSWLEKAITGGGDVGIMAESLHQLAIIHQIKGDKVRFRHAVEQLESLSPDHPGLAGLKAVV